MKYLQHNQVGLSGNVPDKYFYGLPQSYIQFHYIRFHILSFKKHLMWATDNAQYTKNKQCFSVTGMHLLRIQALLILDKGSILQPFM